MRPILLTLFGLPLYAYGTMLCLSVIVGRLVAVRLAKRAGMDAALMDRCCLWTMAGAIAGARLLFVLTNPDQFSRPVDIFRLWDGGIVAYGGFLGGFAASAAFCRIHSISILAWADCATPSLCLGLVLTRLYESLAGLALLGLALAVRRRRPIGGRSFLAVVLGYAVPRYVIEIVREDPQRGAIGPFSTSQVVAVITFASAATALYAMRQSRAVILRSGSHVTS